jgi:hypothetical protein
MLTGNDFHAAGRRHGLYDSELAGPRGYRWIPKNRRPRHVRRDFFEQFQPFSAQIVLEHHKAGYVAARPRQALDEA